MGLVSIPTWESFRLRVDIGQGARASGWKYIGGQWTVASEEVHEALLGVLFTHAESLRMAA